MIDSGTRRDEVIGLETALAGVCERLEPDAVPLPEAAEIWTSLARMEKLVAGAKVRMARRAAASRH